MNNKPLIIIWALLALLICAGVSYSQAPGAYNQRDDQYRLLGLKRAKGAYEVARSEFERQRKLFERKLITTAEMDRARNLFSDAEVNYQQSLLAVLFEEKYVSVTEALKFQDSQGVKRVRITLANLSGGSAEFQKLLNIEDDLFRSLQPDVINNIYISILNADGAIISQPYERKLEELRFGEPTSVEFTLLQDLDAVTVYLIYSNGTERSFKIFLQKDESVNRVMVQSEQFSQEVDLGQTSSFDLSFELFSGAKTTYALEVVNLPREISRTFKGASGRVRLSQMKFTESTRTKSAGLEITMPDRPTDDVAMDKPITFYALVIPREKMIDLPDLRSRVWSLDDIEALDVGFVRLEAVPRG